MGSLLILWLAAAAPAHRLPVLEPEDQEARAAELRARLGDEVERVSVDRAGQFRVDFKERSAPDRSKLQLRTSWVKDATGACDESCDLEAPLPVCVRWCSAFGRTSVLSELRLAELRPKDPAPGLERALGQPFVETTTRQRVRFTGSVSPCGIDCAVPPQPQYEPVGPAFVERRQLRTAADQVSVLRDVRAECGKRFITLHPVFDTYLTGVPGEPLKGPEPTVVTIRREGTLPLIDAETGQDVRKTAQWFDVTTPEDLLKRCGF